MTIKASILWSDRHKGIGSDGLVLIDKSTVPEADFSMRIFNADGSEAMMCGNASRCIGKYLYERGLTDKTEIRLLTLSGVKILNLHIKDNKVESVTVDMLEPRLEDDTQFLPHHGVDKGTFVSMVIQPSLSVAILSLHALSPMVLSVPVYGSVVVVLPRLAVQVLVLLLWQLPLQERLVVNRRL